MLKSTVVILAMFGSVFAQASPGVIIINAVQDNKAVGPQISNLAIQDNKAVGPQISNQAVQDQKSVSVDSQVETAQLLDLNEGF